MSLIENESTGVLKEFYDIDSGVIQEDVTLKEFEFVQIGAQLTLNVGDTVIFVTITTPSGKVIVKSVIKSGI